MQALAMTSMQRKSPLQRRMSLIATMRVDYRGVIKKLCRGDLPYLFLAYRNNLWMKGALKEGMDALLAGQLGCRAVGNPYFCQATGLVCLFTGTSIEGPAVRRINPASQNAKTVIYPNTEA